MSNFSFPEAIKSRPTYARLEARAGKSYLFVADAEGAEAIIDLASNDKSLMSKSHVIYIPKNTGKKYTSQLEKLNINQLYIGPSYAAAQSRLRAYFGILSYGATIISIRNRRSDRSSTT